MSFDSGSDIVMEAPCEMVVLSSESARLLSGSVFVNVTDLSNGFVLETPESRIIDEGTEYAVALDQNSTEVAVSHTSQRKFQLGRKTKWISSIRS